MESRRFEDLVTDGKITLRWILEK